MTARRIEAMAVSVCVVSGLALSCLPNLIAWARTGDPSWFGSARDETVYLWHAADAYHHHPFRTADPLRDGSSTASSPWLHVVPFVVTAKALGLGPESIGLLWRLWAGASIPLGLYALMRQLLARPTLAAAVAIILMADCGTSVVMPGVRPIELAALVLAGRSPWEQGTGFGTIGSNYLWRVTTPGITSGFQFAFLALLIRARSRPSWPRMAAAGVAFGLLFQVYLYYWTAAGLMLVLGASLDEGGRRAYRHTLWIGGLIGVPAVLAGMAMALSGDPGALHRAGIVLTVPRLSGLFLARRDLLLLAIALPWTMRRARDLMPVALLAVAGLMLANHQVVTGLQVQNFHFRDAVYGPMLSTLALVLIAREAAAWRPRGAGVAASLLAAGELALGLGFRTLDATTQAPGAPDVMGEYHSYRAQRIDRPAVRLAPGATVAGAEGFQAWASIFEGTRPLAGEPLMTSGSVGPEEWAARSALDGYVRGASVSEFHDGASALLDAMVHGPWAYDPSRRARTLAEWSEAFIAVAADPDQALDRFHVRYVALDASGPPPRPSPGRWHLIEEGATWRVWERRTDGE